ncbi:outer membrane beta-barrel protein [Steroidobacter sp.]|uniref:outer membrane beta-barrel protein n=1 Tax=Steroidobacter sp. TaxID=1978227 RepID=UPI001A3D5722|nr:outer membrane beta-barrel protein [Steroidobacter sp.]MBL8269993.1 outer membrane beta-barrel protein [Steroidobacter sp.]
MRRFLLPLVLLAASPAAMAMDPSLRGWYIGGGIGQATVELEDNDSLADFDGDDTGYKFIFGYRIIDWVAVELNYAQYGEAQDEIFGFTVENEFTALSLSALGMLPLGNFDLFGRLGVANVEGDFRIVNLPGGADSDDNIEPMFGVGVQYRPTPHLGIRVEYELIQLGFDDDDDDERDGDDWVDMVSLGVTYKF